MLEADVFLCNICVLHLSYLCNHSAYSTHLITFVVNRPACKLMFIVVTVMPIFSQYLFPQICATERFHSHALLHCISCEKLNMTKIIQIYLQQ
jgi:hypothetical protein